MPATKPKAQHPARQKMPYPPAVISADQKKVFARLKQILKGYAQEFEVSEDSTTTYMLSGPSRNKSPKRFGGAAIRQDHVTFFSCPEILRGASPALKKHIKGTSSIALTTPDESLLKEVGDLVATRFRDYKTNGWL